MKRLQTSLMKNIDQMPLKLAVLLLLVAPISGCQSMMTKSKTKELRAQEKFSCGEPLPGRPSPSRAQAASVAE